MAYTVTIGLEIHAELKTATKMFCNSKNDPDESEPNVNICPVCLAHPGTLPTINKEAIRHVLKVGLAVGGTFADYTEFDRKNYFYPDLPKGYQISQYKYPLVSGGELNGVSITRIHLEEDTARSQHGGAGYSLVDFNRAGVPLMELVTEPVMHSAEEAVRFAKELQLILRYLNVGGANMEKGEMRVEANISISDSSAFGTKVEVKNLNSFRAVEQAIVFEIGRQSNLLQKGEKVIQETRGWNEEKRVTFPQRMKEESHDYRYFPDPDLPTLRITTIPEFHMEELKKEIPELPHEKRERFRKELGIKDEDIEVYLYSKELLAPFIEKVAEALHHDRTLLQRASNYITSDLLGYYKEKKYPDSFFFTAEDFAKLIEMTEHKKVSSRGAKDILKVMVGYGGDPEKIAEERHLLQVSNEDSLKQIVKKITEENPQVVAAYKSGKEASLQFLVGQGMKESKGRANPIVLRDLLLKHLK